MIVTEQGCVVHRGVQFDRCEDGYQVFKCPLCRLDVEREAEDSQG